MENTLIFSSDEEVRFGKLLKYIIPTYLTSLFNTVYTIIDGIFVSAYVGTDALAAINIVYPLVNVLTGIALAFATGGSAVAALHIGGGRKDRADRSFSCSIAASILLGSSVSLIIILNLSKILTLLGATDLTMVDCNMRSGGCGQHQSSLEKNCSPTLSGWTVRLHTVLQQHCLAVF